jgi:hypothetical protein
MTQPTPGDLGIMAAAMDDAIRQGLGDGSIVAEIAVAAFGEGVTLSRTEAGEIAYSFYHAKIGR